jgi:hypothetical protein
MPDILPKGRLTMSVPNLSQAFSKKKGKAKMGGKVLDLKVTGYK